MARINIVNADNKIDATPQRAYFKLKQTGGPKGEKGDTGAQGPIGPQGPQGASASVVVNSTTTLPAGSSATVENIGTPQNVKLNFGIPTGPQGPQGEQGPQGAQGPQGVRGEKGAKGDNGAAAKVTVGNTNTGAAGTNAIVENTGSDTYAVLNFTIPRGDKGETGPMPDIAQTTGQATDEVMSQKATTDALATKQNTLTAGTGITIASDTVSADTTVLATKADLNDYAPQATTYTKTETDTLLAPKLEADVVDSLPATGEEGKLYLTPKAHTTSTATGNPITATVTEEAGALESFQLDGDTFQQTYTGKNLVKPVTTSSITSSYNDTTGEYSVSRATAASWPWLTGYCTLSQTITSGTTITISRNVGSSFNFWVRTYHPDDTYSSYNLGTTTLSQVITEDKDINRIVIMANAVPDNFSYSFKLQLELGNEATTFERYVGGTASPNPDYPQAVQTVTGEQTVEIVGKNLFNQTDTHQQGYINDAGGITDSNFSVAYAGYYPVEPEHTYTISYNIVKAGSSIRYIGFYDSSFSFISRAETSEVSAFTFSTPANTRYLRVSFRRAAGMNASTFLTDFINNIQIEAGPTATTYAPYHATSYPINLGKNLYDGSVFKEDYLLSSNGGEVYSLGAVITEQIKIEPNTVYTASAIWNSGGGDTYIRIGVYDGSMGWIIRYSGQLDKITFTTPANARYIRLSYYKYQTKSVQLELGSTATSYAPYFTPIELCKLGTYQDYIYKDGDTWKVHKATSKYNFGIVGGTGANWELSNHRLYLTKIWLNNNGIYMPSYSDTSTTAPILANRFKAISFEELYTNGKNGIALSSTDVISMRNNSWTDADSAKSDINGSTMAYALATATDTAITDATLIAQLEAIRTASLGNGANTITNSATAPNLAGDMEIGYYSYNPRSRYDKWLWLDINNEYEQIGS